ncbi:acetolactate synthase small subunit [Campylobacter canadensis]|uniref:Acetolactate synthase small subunit n=1 Tax=Campylobacter canadensis TaxID=449520 RepID=A0ABS7WQF4_9BACT|nr:acetolactate synthase small subunit [Campylobacter canadensis]MBZ7986743.1 acetolactate synthase small subunit [Campylobacter canadensis]MBZ7994568.1 acetolactate synthase small subunit [Campylobacter canadensis]MBZ7997075.1 acetolactate synthase small subunit [Campylobacter canadensis]MBZ7997780.1 acetolactate synthase small subunit [Campylobacter canadensis]MBZ7999899.1 acetolactate synthase small subunit [Campylobacter canadensis]
MKRVLSIIVSNEHGVLSRVVGLFSGRGYNIDSLTVAPIVNTEFSRINISTSEDNATFEQITKQLHKLIPVYKVLEDCEFVERECALIKISANENLSGLDTLLKSYGGNIAHSNDEFITICVNDTNERISNFIKTMKRFNPIDIARSGVLLMEIK